MTLIQCEKDAIRTPEMWAKDGSGGRLVIDIIQECFRKNKV